MKLSELSKNPKNPRTITEEKLKQLALALKEFGDLSGIVFNRKTKRLVSGHQRQKSIDGEITYLKKYPKPTRNGTVAEGYIEVNGERFSYREVLWSEDKEKAANIAANKNAGEWDLPQLGKWMKELSSTKFDINLTMFDESEIDKLFPDERKTKNTTEEIDIAGVSKLQHECPKCGFTFGNGK